MNKRVKKKLQKRYNIKKYKKYKFLYELRKEISRITKVPMKYIYREVYDIICTKNK